MSSTFFNLDNSHFSKVGIYLLQNIGIPQNLSDIGLFSGVSRGKTKLIINRMYKLGMVKKYTKSDLHTFCFDINNPIVQKFNDYYGSVVKIQYNKKN